MTYTNWIVYTVSNHVLRIKVLLLRRHECFPFRCDPLLGYSQRLTAERDDAHGVQLVLRSDVRAHADDEDVAEAGGGRHHPDEDPQHDVGQQVLEGGDAVGVGLAAAHMGGVAAVLELLEVAAIGGLEQNIMKTRANNNYEMFEFDAFPLHTPFRIYFELSEELLEKGFNKLN